MSAPEIWAGMECTVNRVGHRYFDQLARTEHDRRDEDLDRFAALGIRTLRQPLLWERVAPRVDRSPDWAWCDRRMGRLRGLGIRPVVGLMHHGSGPSYTSLVDPAFPEHFEHYAANVARRYPWAPSWILINEPLTTARFSCLYGHWYPHARDNRLFAQAIVGQCVAIARASAIVRAVNPDVQLVQSEDLGRASSTPLLTYQAEMENERRWLTFDLLCGRVRPGHPMWEWLRRAGADLNALAWLADHPAPPDLLGINHYLTSERFLDERVERYPRRWRGGNERHHYADVEAVRVCEEGPFGLEALLREAWDRYQIPIAITEAHLDCTRDEQVRWLVEQRAICEALARDHVPVVALTVWSLLGSYNWNELMTIDADYYESGIFDIRGSTPRDTRLADVVRCWTGGRPFDHPVLDGQGWWHRPVRLLYPPVPRGGTKPHNRLPAAARRRHIMVVGASAVLRREIECACDLRDLAVQFRGTEELASGDPDAIIGPDGWAIVFAGLLRECREDRLPHASVEQIERLAAAATAAGYHLTLLSSQQVFGSARHAPYLECDAPAPESDEGRLATAMERTVATLNPAALIARAALCFADRAHPNIEPEQEPCVHGAWFPTGIAGAASCSLTYLPDLIRVMLDLIVDGEQGIWHLANRGEMTVAGVQQTLGGAASPAQDDDALVSYVLDTTRGALLPHIDAALARAGYGAGSGSSMAPWRISASL